LIPRYQRILFWSLAGAILLMALVLLRGCEQAREKLTRHRDDTPLAAPVVTASESVSLALANDSDGSIYMSDRDVALPTESTARARAILTRLMGEYSSKHSEHPIESGPAIDDVFLLELPLRPAAEPAKPADDKKTADDRKIAAEEKSEIFRRELATWNASPNSPFNLYAEPLQPGGQLAVVNLRGSFADHHPSGIEPETLTIESMIGTLRANFPRIEAVRFLVDGQPRETLNGHADLRRVYRAIDTTTKTTAPADLPLSTPEIR
jgi:hypothetical protein